MSSISHSNARASQVGIAVTRHCSCIYVFLSFCTCVKEIVLPFVFSSPISFIHVLLSVTCQNIMLMGPCFKRKSPTSCFCIVALCYSSCIQFEMYLYLEHSGFFEWVVFGTFCDHCEHQRCLWWTFVIMAISCLKRMSVALQKRSAASTSCIAEGT